MSEDERFRKDSVPPSEETLRPDSRSSSVISRTSSPEHLQDDVSAGKQENSKHEDSADVAARGIINSRRSPGGVAQSGMRLIAACEVGPDNSQNSQETGGGPSQDQQMTVDLRQAPEAEEEDLSSQEIYFFNKEFSTSGPPLASRGRVKPKKSSGPQTPSGMPVAFKSSQQTDEVPVPVKGKQEVDRDATVNPQELDQTTQEIVFFNKDSSSSRPSSASSSVAGERDRREVSFQATDEDHLSKKERSFVSYTGNTTIEVVSICTQTEWSWLNDMLLYQEMMARAERTERGSRDIPMSPSANSHAGSIKTRRRRSIAGSRRTSVSSDKTAQVKDEDNSSLPELDEGNEPKLSLAGVEEGSTGRSKSKSSGVPRSRQSVVSSLPRTPKGEDVLFRPTTVEPDSSSDSEDYENYDLEREYLLPSIGPPTILQYMKESQHPPMSNEEVEDRQELAKDEMLKKSMFSGPCMFCHEEILPFPTLDELERLTPDQLYCCPQYERLIKFELAQRTDSGHLADELIDIKPHAPHGTKAARRAAKERAAERAREREMERQRAAGANPTNFYALTRQMKTITYSLASTKCMEEGWTVRPESRSSIDTEQWQDPFVIEVNPLPLRKQTFLERFYDNNRSKRFLLLLPDGTGTCYYPSGNIAVMITATEKGKLTYIVFDDDEENESNSSRMLAIFQPSGHGTCYFRDGKVRLVLNPFSGVLLDHRGTRKKRWLWHNLTEHVHAPPFQPVTFRITKQLSIRCLSQNKTVLTFNHGKYTARFNVGSKLKAVAKAKTPTSRDSYETYLAEVKQFVNIVLDRYQNAMRLPNYPRLDKIPLPLHLQRAKDSGRKSRLQGSSPSSQRETTVIVN